MNMEKQIIEIPIYNCYVVFGSYKNLEKTAWQESQNKGEKTATCGIENGNVYFAFTEKLGGSALAHECLHIVNLIFEMKGIHTNESNDEHTAYFLEYVYKILSDKIFYSKKGDKNVRISKR